MEPAAYEHCSTSQQPRDDRLPIQHHWSSSHGNCISRLLLIITNYILILTKTMQLSINSSLTHTNNDDTNWRIFFTTSCTTNTSFSYKVLIAMTTMTIISWLPLLQNTIFISLIEPMSILLVQEWTAYCHYTDDRVVPTIQLVTVVIVNLYSAFMWSHPKRAHYEISTEKRDKT